MFNKLIRRSGLAKLAGVALTAGIIAAAFHTSAPVKASDHDDGETNIKARNLNLTDLYVFREDWQDTVTAGTANNMIFIMNTNPRSLPRQQQYFFNSNAVYTFWVSRRTAQNDAVTGVPDMSFDFNFSTPTGNTQNIFLNRRIFQNGQEVSRETLNCGTTTPAAPLLGNPAAVNNPVATSAGQLTIFAGLREDPFFFDVDAFFRTRAVLANAANASPNQTIPPRNASTILSLLGSGAPAGPSPNVIDFAKGYNVNSIVMRVPITTLQNGTTQRIFDVWETISVPESLASVQ